MADVVSVVPARATTDADRVVCRCDDARGGGAKRVGRVVHQRIVVIRAVDVSAGVWEPKRVG